MQVFAVSLSQGLCVTGISLVLICRHEGKCETPLTLINPGEEKNPPCFIVTFWSLHKLICTYCFTHNFSSLKPVCDFISSSGLLLQESERFSEALHYYKLAIGSRRTLACEFSSF